MEQVKGVVLAAGKGVRMQSDVPKVLHKVGGVPMVCRAVACLVGAGIKEVMVVVGDHAEKVRGALTDAGLSGVTYVEQTARLGTAHALLHIGPLVMGWSGELVILNGDTPLVRMETIRTLVAAKHEARADAALVTAEVRDPTGYGRVVRSVEGWVTRIVEEADATPEERKILEMNAGIYALSVEGLFPALQKIRPSPKKGEFYLTDLIGIWAAQGKRVMAMVVEDASEVVGVDTLERLKVVRELVQRESRHGSK